MYCLSHSITLHLSVHVILTGRLATVSSQYFLWPIYVLWLELLPIQSSCIQSEFLCIEFKASCWQNKCRGIRSYNTSRVFSGVDLLTGVIMAAASLFSLPINSFLPSALNVCAHTTAEYEIRVLTIAV